MNPRTFEKKLAMQLDKYIATTIPNPVSRDNNNASDLGVDCDTYHVLCRVKGELRPKTTIAQKKMFRVGTEWEEPNLHFLAQAKLPIERAAQHFKWAEKKITGWTDGRAWIKPRGAPHRIEIPAEHKACSPNVFRTIVHHKVHGIPLTQSKYFWVRRYPAQLTVYMLLKNVEFGLWIFFKEVGGDFLFWMFRLDYEYGETLLQRAERANENVEKGIIPEPNYTDICPGCAFAMAHCYPDKDFGPGFDLLSDEEFEAKLNRWYELSENAKEYKELDGEIKDAVRGKKLIVGDFKIESKPFTTTKYTLPDDIKAKYAQKVEGFRTSIERLTGGEIETST